MQKNCSKKLNCLQICTRAIFVALSAEWDSSLADGNKIDAGDEVWQAKITKA